MEDLSVIKNSVTGETFIEHKFNKSYAELSPNCKVLFNIKFKQSPIEQVNTHRMKIRELEALKKADSDDLFYDEIIREELECIRLLIN